MLPSASHVESIARYVSPHAISAIVHGSSPTIGTSISMLVSVAIGATLVAPHVSGHRTSLVVVQIMLPFTVQGVPVVCSNISVNVFTSVTLHEPPGCSPSTITSNIASPGGFNTILQNTTLPRSETPLVSNTVF